MAVPPDMRDAIRLDAWLIAKGLEKQKSTFTSREILRNGPSETRSQAALEPALRHLKQCSRDKLPTGMAVAPLLHPQVEYVM